MKILKGDYIIICVVIVVALLLLIVQFSNVMMSNKASDKIPLTVLIFANRTLYKAINIDQNTNTEIDINMDDNGNYINMGIKIRNGEIFIEHSNCHNKACMAIGRIKSENQSIICLPNKILIKIIKTEENKIDEVDKMDEIAG